MLVGDLMGGLIALIIVDAAICLILQKYEKETQDTGKLTVCMISHILFLIIHGILLLFVFPILVLSELLFFLYLAAVAIFVIWHICLIKSASRYKRYLIEKENTIQVVYCNACGAACPADSALFCRKCGKKLEHKENGSW